MIGGWVRSAGSARNSRRAGPRILILFLPRILPRLFQTSLGNGHASSRGFRFPVLEWGWPPGDLGKQALGHALMCGDPEARGHSWFGERGIYDVIAIAIG